jgi:hypothetical protein
LGFSLRPILDHNVRSARKNHSVTRSTQNRPVALTNQRRRSLYVAVKVPPHVDLIKTAICTRRDP